jgi:hypothetical protein
MSILTVFGQTITAAQANIPNGSASDVLVIGLNIVYFLAGAFAVVMIIVSGFRLVTNGSEPEVVKKSRNAILYAAVGIVVVLTAFTVTQFVIGSF